MRSCDRAVFVVCLAEVLAMVTCGGAAGAADCNAAIDKAIAEWKKKEPTWTYPESVSMQRSMPGSLPGMGMPGTRSPYDKLDQRTRIAFGRPIAKALAIECGKSGVKALQARVEDAPELILFSLDELGASDIVADCITNLFWKKEDVKVSPGWRYECENRAAFEMDVLVWASMCSPTTRRGTALALLKKMPQKKTLQIDEIADYMFAFALEYVVVFGNEDAAKALESAASDPRRFEARELYLDLSARIRNREALPLKVREIRDRDDLLFWQASFDGVRSNAEAPWPIYEQSAQTLANRHERISTDYLLEKLRAYNEEYARYSCDPNYRPRFSVGGSPDLILFILVKQRDPTAIPYLQKVAKENSSLAAEVERTIDTIRGTNEAHRPNKAGTPGAARDHAQPDAAPKRSPGDKRH